MDLEALKSKIEEKIAAWEVPGLGLGVAKDGKVLLSTGYGIRNEQGDKWDGETLFLIGSCSKAFTATCALILCERGQLDLDKPITQYLPEFRLMDEYAEKHVTTRDLLCHRSGLPRHEYAWYRADFTRAELVHNLRYHKPNLQLRQGFQYNNLGFVTVGYLIERITGKTWEAFVEEEIFRPLGMTRTTCFTDVAVKDGNVACGFARPELYSFHGMERIPFYRTHVEDAKMGVGAPYGPAGSILSCASDMLKWGMFQLSDGTLPDGTKLLSKESMTLLHTPHIHRGGALEKDGVSFNMYALGWGTYSYHGHRVLHHNGGIDGSTTGFYLVPDANLAVIANVNMDTNLFSEAAASDVVDAILGIEGDQYARYHGMMEELYKGLTAFSEQMRGKHVEGTQPSHPLADYAGSYHMDGYMNITIAQEGDKLRLCFNGYDVELSHFHYDVFRMEGYIGELPPGLPVQFHYDNAGKISSLSIPLVEDAGYPPIEFRKVD